MKMELNNGAEVPKNVRMDDNSSVTIPKKIKFSRVRKESLTLFDICSGFLNTKNTAPTAKKKARKPTR